MSNQVWVPRPPGHRKKECGPAARPREALLVGKVLRSAVANAEHNKELDADTLYVKSAVATTAGMLKRMMPRARGSADTIKKRMSHITVVVDVREEKPEEETKKSKRPRKADKKPAETAAAE